MIRPTLESETEVLKQIAAGTHVFKPMEIDALGEVLDDYHAGLHRDGHKAVTYEQDEKPIGFAYYAPTAMTDRTWHLYWIFVDKQTHGKAQRKESHDVNCESGHRHQDEGPQQRVR